MDATGPIVRFAGDLDDPWVQEILGSIADQPCLHAVMCGDEVPDRLCAADQPPRLLILHRSRLSLADAVRIEQWRLSARMNTTPRVILCFSPYVRYVELERCSRGVDVAIPEAIAVETLSRHVDRLLGPIDEPGRAGRVAHCFPIQVVSANREFQAILTEICLAEGFDVSVTETTASVGQGQTERIDRDSAPVLTLLDVSVLEPEWTRLLEERSRIGPVIALLGFADRAIVAQARTAGAAACLDLPVDSNDLLYVIERVNRKWRSDQEPGPPAGSSRGTPCPLPWPAGQSVAARRYASVIRGRLCGRKMMQHLQSKRLQPGGPSQVKSMERTSPNSMNK